MSRWSSSVFLVLSLVLGSGCARQSLPTSPPVEIESLEAAQELSACKKGGAFEVIGRTRSGALYAMYRPERWNRRLVLYAHGFTAPGNPIELPTGDSIESLRDLLLERGFGVAYSSYAETGLGVKDGIQQTERLQERFASRLGHPRRTYLVGHSMGGLVVVGMAERDPYRYDGILTMSGLLGGTRSVTDYVATIRVLFDHFYPDALPGDLMHLPKGLDLNRDVIGPAVAAMQTNPQGALAMSQIDQARLPFASAEELVTSIARALGLHAVELGDLLERTGGTSFFDNSKTSYTGRLPAPVLDDLNARVGRYVLEPRAERFLRTSYAPSGRLRIPMLTLYNERDPVVGAFNETAYRDLVAKRGRLWLLEQRAFARYGHTSFSPEEMISAFEDLVRRAEGRGKEDEKDGDRAIAGAPWSEVEVLAPIGAAVAP